MMRVTLIHYFWTPGTSEGVLSDRPCPSVSPSVVRPSLDISETVHWFFLIFCIKLEHHKGKKSWGSQMGEDPHFWGIFGVFVHISVSSH